MNMLVSADDVTYTQVGGTVTFPESVITTAQVKPLVASGVRYVRFDVLTGGAGHARHGLAEVRFEGTLANEPPVAQCADVTVSADANCQAEASIDNGSSDPDGDALTITQSPAGPYALGNTLVTLTVSDGIADPVTCQATVTVNDAEDPLATCPADIEVNTDPGLCSAVVTFDDATATDNCAVQSVVQTGGDVSGTAFPKGVSTITYLATDTSGNTDDCSFTITVNDNEDPVLSPIPDAEVSVDCIGLFAEDSDSADVDLVPDDDDICPLPLPTLIPSIPGVMASDNCGVVVFNEPTDPETPLFGDCPGVIVRDWYAEDAAGNSAETRQLVLIRKVCVKKAKDWADTDTLTWVSVSNMVEVIVYENSELVEDGYGPIVGLNLAPVDLVDVCGDALSISAMDALAILNAKPKGDASIELLQQLIAAILNRAQGAGACASTIELIELAKVALCGYDPETSDKEYRKYLKEIAKALKEFNDGKGEMPKCPKENDDDDDADDDSADDDSADDPDTPF
ncbi:MAG: HYR domain-containing protein [Planctomycetota bacterium]|jgi:hypothetical protein